MRIGGQTIEAKERSDAAQRGSPSQPRDARATSSSGDSVRLSSAGARAGAALQSSDADRSARIETLRHQVSRGEYAVDFARLADCMVREEGARFAALREGGP